MCGLGYHSSVQTPLSDMLPGDIITEMVKGVQRAQAFI